MCRFAVQNGTFQDAKHTVPESQTPHSAGRFWPENHGFCPFFCLNLLLFRCTLCRVRPISAAASNGCGCTPVVATYAGGSPFFCGAAILAAFVLPDFNICRFPAPVFQPASPPQILGFAAAAFRLLPAIRCAMPLPLFRPCPAEMVVVSQSPPHRYCHVVALAGVVRVAVSAFGAGGKGVPPTKKAGPIGPA